MCYGRPANEESAFYRIRILFTTSECVRNLMLYPFGHRVMQSKINIALYVLKINDFVVILS